MTPLVLADAVRAAVVEAVESGAISLAADEVPTSVDIERPKQRDHGDYATNIALQLARPAQRSPREIASLLAERLIKVEGIASVDVAGPGFLNIRLDTATAGELARTIVAAGTSYGRGDALAGQRINVEFISANPTGPLHLGHTRWAAVGDALGRVLEAAGASVVREFYINDRGRQLELFGESVEAAALGNPIPEDGYKGDYIPDLAEAVVAADPSILDLEGEPRRLAFREAAYALQLQRQKDVLDAFRTHFDEWSSERTLHESGAVERGLEVLRDHGHVFEADGATWLRTTDFGDDRDRVLVRSNGALTYFASDTAYYVDKRARGFDRCIYLLGADHHGYVGRLRAVAACAGDDPDLTLDVLIGQLVKMYKGGEEVRLSKRAGDLITLDEVVEDVGVDAARYTLCRYPNDSPLTLDLDHMTAQTNDNPVFYVQYAHARIASVLNNAGGLGLTADLSGFDPAVLAHVRENDLLGVLGEFPRVVATAAELREPHRIARYLEDVAAVYHRFYDACRVLPIGDEAATPVTTARLVLCAATKQVLANGLDLLGVSAPERM